MKLEAIHGETTYRIEVDNSASNQDGFNVTIGSAAGNRQHRVRVLGRSQGRWTLEIDGTIEDVVVSEVSGERVVEWESRTFAIEIYSLEDRFHHAAAESESDGVATLKAQMPGKVVQVLVGARHAAPPIRFGYGRKSYLHSVLSLFLSPGDPSNHTYLCLGGVSFISHPARMESDLVNLR